MTRSNITSDESNPPRSVAGGDRPFILVRIGRGAKNVKDDLAILFLFMLGYEYLKRDDSLWRGNGCG